MRYVKRSELKKRVLPGRALQEAVGKGAALSSGAMTVGFATYSAESGPMEPHRHVEETVYVLNCPGGRVRVAEVTDVRSPDQVSSWQVLELEPGMVLHFPPMEFHVFEYDQGGFVDIIYIYGQVDRLRPEDD